MEIILNLIIGLIFAYCFSGVLTLLQKLFTRK